MSSKSGNPFLEDEEEIDDFTFLNRPKHEHESEGFFPKESKEEGRRSSWESKQMQIMEECRRIEERTLQSSVNSLGLIHESEQVGVMTAEELVRQREQLHNVEQNLDEINSTMRISQKHINSIKSMFGGIKNYFSRSNGTKSDSATLTTQMPSSKPVTSGLQETVGNLRATERSSEACHPALRLRGIDTADFQTPNDDYDHSRREPGSSRGMGVSPTSGVPGSYSQNVDEQLDKNLQSMSLGLGRLKSLAIGLNEEIETHNDMLDRINVKVDRADESLEHQNRQIKRILKK